MVIASFLAVAVLVYTYFGYPVVIGVLARLWPAQRKEDPSYLPTVTVCIPVFNAASYLPAKVESLFSLDYPRDKLEVLLYSDGSTDDTVHVARQLAERDPRVKVIVSEARRGKPIGVNTMLGVATGEVLLMTDVRQPLVSGALRALVRLLSDPTAGCVSGNLVLKGSAGSGAYWRYENWIRLQEGRFRSMVGVTGPIYAIRRADMSQLPEGVILDDMWVPMRLRLEGREILFAQDAVAYDDAFGDEREFGRKVRTLAGNYQLFSLLPALLDPLRNPSWFEIFSHKLLRLVCPWALVALLITSTAAWIGAEASGDVSSTLYATRALFGGQAAFYLLAVLGGAAGKLGSLARTFVVLNAAAVVGLWRFLRGSQKVTW